jgi:hypothetical protein
MTSILDRNGTCGALPVVRDQAAALRAARRARSGRVPGADRSSRHSALRESRGADGISMAVRLSDRTVSQLGPWYAVFANAARVATGRRVRRA